MGCCCGSDEDGEKEQKDCCKDKKDKNHVAGEKKPEKKTSELPLAGIVKGH